MATTATAARVRHIAAAKRAKAPASARTSLDDAGSSDDQMSEVKYSIGFILNLCPSDAVKVERVEAPTPLETRPEPRTAVIQNHPRDPKEDTKRSKPRARSNVETTIATPPTKPTRARSTSSGAKTKSSANGKAKAALTYEQKRLARKCTVEDCMKYTINKGLCFRHGGGKKCTFEDCNASAKIAGLCWKHGGSIQCVIDGCDRRGKSRGLCWAHGGGTKCHADTCTKVAVSNGYCWAHGGGKRCHFDGCQRPAYERTLNYCPKHFKRFENGEEVLEL